MISLQGTFLTEDAADAEALAEWGFTARPLPEDNDKIGPLIAWVGRGDQPDYLVPGNSDDRRKAADTTAARLLDLSLKVKIINLPYRQGQITLKDFIDAAFDRMVESGLDCMAFPWWIEHRVENTPFGDEVFTDSIMADPMAHEDDEIFS
jgi:hypothetical protein